MNNKKRKIFFGQVINTLISIIFIIVFVTVIALILQKFVFKKEVPDLFGYKILQVMSGSMSGEFETGDTILIKKISNESNLKIGDVVTYKIKKNTLVTHRIVNMQRPYGMVVIFTIPIVMLICVIYSEKVKAEKRNKRREKRLNYELQKSKEHLENKKKED